ncbi:hypothetical protein LCGC14_1165310 [marine sediment metagenome]|uniref:Lipoprotein n=1 Tax=marine sediment metagenome TaxID=412755 RepID=A0A0F9LWD0_9ZZZZ
MKRLLLISMLAIIVSACSDDELGSSSSLRKGAYASLFYVTESFDPSLLGTHGVFMNLRYYNETWEFYIGPLHYDDVTVKNNIITAIRIDSNLFGENGEDCTWTMTDVVTFSPTGSSGGDRIDGWNYIDIEFSNCNPVIDPYSLEAYILGVNIDIF